jgi:hypothetical protein
MTAVFTTFIRLTLTLNSLTDEGKQRHAQRNHEYDRNKIRDVPRDDRFRQLNLLLYSFGERVSSFLLSQD